MKKDCRYFKKMCGFFLLPGGNIQLYRRFYYSLKKVVFLNLFLCGLLSVLNCSYHLGFRERSLPGGYTQVAVPVFKNGTKEVGIETYFTNELIRQLSRSAIAQIVSKENAVIILEGSVDDITFVRSAKATQKEIKHLPIGAVLTTEYRVHLVASLRLRRVSDNKILWQDIFKNESSYFAPQLGSPGVNASNVLYNQSALDLNFAKMAEDMMIEAHDRLTENF